MNKTPKILFKNAEPFPPFPFKGSASAFLAALVSVILVSLMFSLVPIQTFWLCLEMIVLALLPTTAFVIVSEFLCVLIQRITEGEYMVSRDLRLNIFSAVVVLVFTVIMAIPIIAISIFHPYEVAIVVAGFISYHVIVWLGRFIYMKVKGHSQRKTLSKYRFAAHSVSRIHHEHLNRIVEITGETFAVDKVKLAERSLIIPDPKRHVVVETRIYNEDRDKVEEGAFILEETESTPPTLIAALFKR